MSKKEKKERFYYKDTDSFYPSKMKGKFNIIKGNGFTFYIDKNHRKNTENWIKEVKKQDKYLENEFILKTERWIKSELKEQINVNFETIKRIKKNSKNNDIYDKTNENVIEILLQNHRLLEKYKSIK